MNGTLPPAFLPAPGAGPVPPPCRPHTPTAGLALLLVIAMLTAGCGQASEMLGLSKKQPPAPAAASTESLPVESSARRVRPASTAPARAKSPKAEAVRARTADAPLVPVAVPAADATSAPVVAVTALPAVPPPVEETVADVAVVASPSLSDDASPIYSQDDGDVTPARLLTKQTGGPLFHNVRADVNTMELVISKQGRVEQVRLTSPTKRMTDMLLLSGAKTWKFQPAMKDGTPVRYRTHYSWETVQ